MAAKSILPRHSRVKERKRQLMVDVLGLVISGFVSAANVADVKAAPVVLVPALENNPRLVKVLADQSYRGAIALLLQQAFDWTLELTKKLGQSFVVEPWRWVVERTLCLVRKCAAIMSRLSGTP